MSRYWLVDEAATAAFAAQLARTAPSGAVVFLHGDLGAGKSTLARAWLRTLGVTGTVRSPTYTLVERYPVSAGAEALHLDLYRIGGAGELEFLGLDDVDAALWLVEWPERGQGGLPPADLHVHLDVSGTGRAVRLDAAGPAGVAWLQALSARADSDGLRPIAEPNP